MLSEENLCKKTLLTKCSLTSPHEANKLNPKMCNKANFEQMDKSIETHLKYLQMVAVWCSDTGTVKI